MTARQLGIRACQSHQYCPTIYNMLTTIYIKSQSECPHRAHDSSRHHRRSIYMATPKIPSPQKRQCRSALPALLGCLLAIPAASLSAQEGESGGVRMHRAEGRCLFLGHRPRCQPLHMRTRPTTIQVPLANFSEKLRKNYPPGTA